MKSLCSIHVAGSPHISHKNGCDFPSLIQIIIQSSIYLFIYLFIYLSIYIYIHIYIYIYIFIFIYIYIYIFPRNFPEIPYHHMSNPIYSPYFPWISHALLPAASCRAAQFAPGVARTRRRPAARMTGLGFCHGKFFFSNVGYL